MDFNNCNVHALVTVDELTYQSHQWRGFRYSMSIGKFSYNNAIGQEDDQHIYFREKQSGVSWMAKVMIFETRSQVFRRIIIMIAKLSIKPSRVLTTAKNWKVVQKLILLNVQKWAHILQLQFGINHSSTIYYQRGLPNIAAYFSLLSNLVDIATHVKTREIRHLKKLNYATRKKKHF